MTIVLTKKLFVTMYIPTAVRMIIGSYAMIWRSSRSAPTWLYGEYEAYAPSTRKMWERVNANMTSSRSPPEKKRAPATTMKTR